MSSVRWGMIGCGSVTELKSGPAFYKAPGSALVAVMGRREEAVRDYAARHGIARFYTDAQALINDPEVDAVYIATPPDSHLEYSLMVAAAGKHCCVEKPMSLNAEQSALMQRTFERAGLHLFVSYYRRSLPRFQQVRDWLRDGRIGELRHLTWTLCKPPAAHDANAANWRTDPSVAQFSVFEDQPLHLEGETQEVLEVPCHAHIQWHHVVAMNAHIRGEAEHPSLAIEALKTDRILDKVLQRNPHHPG